MSTAITQYMQNDVVRERFSELMGERNAAAYISSVLLAVANGKKLSECTPVSIYTSALRAATLRLSVDPGLGQAYLVPFKANATLIIGYKGMYDLAVRTGKYRYINVGRVYEGEGVEENRISGLMTLTGGKASNKVIGYIGAFEMVNGFAKTIYMTCEEIAEYAKRYSQNYSREDSLWKTEREKMEKKTVLRILLRKWGYFDPSDAQVIDEVEAEPTIIINGELTEMEPEEVKTHTAAENLEAHGFGAQIPVEPAKSPAPATPPTNGTKPDEKAWTAWFALIERAENVGVQPWAVDDNITVENLRVEYGKLNELVKAAGVK